jgi:hypothetical protein
MYLFPETAYLLSYPTFHLELSSKVKQNKNTYVTAVLSGRQLSIPVTDIVKTGSKKVIAGEGMPTAAGAKVGRCRLTL